MKSHLLAIATLCFVSTGFNLSVDAQDDFERRHLKHEGSLLLTDIAQNVESDSQTAKDYFNRGNL